MTAPGMYTAHVEIRQEIVSSSEVYRTIHSDFMMFKITCTVFKYDCYATFAEDAVASFFTHDKWVLVSASVS